MDGADGYILLSEALALPNLFLHQTRLHTTYGDDNVCIVPFDSPPDSRLSHSCSLESFMTSVSGKVLVS